MFYFKNTDMLLKVLGTVATFSEYNFSFSDNFQCTSIYSFSIYLQSVQKIRLSPSKYLEFNIPISIVATIGHFNEK
jgi:hypothetical protein